MIGNTIIKYDSLTSTNDFIKENSDSFDHGSIVFAENQTAGKGRNNNTWMSENGNLYFSFILKEDIFRNKIFRILANVSVSIIRLLNDLGIKAMIKYPNDILVEDKKICGILIESYGGLELDYLVVGIGININQVDFKDLNKIATSLRSVTNKNYDLLKILKDFIVYYNSIDYSCMGDLFEEYNEYSLVIGKKYNHNGKLYLIKGIDESGNLVMEFEENIEYISLNSISLEDLS